MRKYRSKLLKDLPTYTHSLLVDVQLVQWYLALTEVATYFINAFCSMVNAGLALLLTLVTICGHRQRFLHTYNMCKQLV